MARKTARNPEGTAFQLGQSVRVERGLSRHSSGVVTPDAQPEWVVFKRVDTRDDEATTYDYRFEEAGSFPEVEPGECPEEAMTLAEQLASEGE